MADYTITYSEGAKGFPSFYSFYPDFMMGMNQFFYTWKGGNLYRHNTNTTYNQYYGINYPSTLTSVFNESPLENKLFKTINLESDDSWETTLLTDIQTTGYIDDDWFEKKEASWFAFVRNDGPTGAATNESEWELRSLNGIGRSTSVLEVPFISAEIKFDLAINIGSIISVGDYLYFAVPPYDTPQFAGEVTQISVDKPNGINSIYIDTTLPGVVSPIPIQDAYYLYIKNPIAESHGVLGHYCQFTVELPIGKAQNKSELFAVESEVMKSYP
jgi:hypothetical protein